MIAIFKNISFGLAIFLIVLLFLIPLFFVPFYDSHDGEHHVARFAAYYSAFKDGQLIPRWAGTLNFNYGTPVFIFFYPLPVYLASFIHHLGINLENTFKILMAFAFVVAPLTFYLWAKTLFRKDIAFIGALFYGLAPYHFLNLYVRGDVGENLAFVFVPLVFLFLEKIIQKFALKDVLFGGLAYGLLILSHNGVSLMFSPIFLIYILLRTTNKKTVISAFIAILVGLALSAFFWVPALYSPRKTKCQIW